MNSANSITPRRLLIEEPPQRHLSKRGPSCQRAPTACSCSSEWLVGNGSQTGQPACDGGSGLISAPGSDEYVPCGHGVSKWQQRHSGGHQSLRQARDQRDGGSVSYQSCDGDPVAGVVNGAWCEPGGAARDHHHVVAGGAGTADDPVFAAEPPAIDGVLTSRGVVDR